MRTLIRSAIVTVRQTADSPLLLPQELIACFEVKVRSSVTIPPSGVFSEGSHSCCDIAALLSALYREAPGLTQCL